MLARGALSTERWIAVTPVIATAGGAMGKGVALSLSFGERPCGFLDSPLRAV